MFAWIIAYITSASQIRHFLFFFPLKCFFFFFFLACMFIMNKYGICYQSAINSASNYFQSSPVGPYWTPVPEVHHCISESQYLNHWFLADQEDLWGHVDHYPGHGDYRGLWRLWVFPPQPLHRVGQVHRLWDIPQQTQHRQEACQPAGDRTVLLHGKCSCNSECDTQGTPEEKKKVQKVQMCIKWMPVSHPV